MNVHAPGSRPDPLPPDAVWGHVDPLAADCAANPAETGLAVLPYSRLKGPGFERLVYELLQAEDQRPWFFGRDGQAQYGIDIVTDAAGSQSVYQCKNHTEIPSWETVMEAVTKFEREWLGGEGLPSPQSFVYCCPQPLNDKAFDVAWLKFKEPFQQRTGVTLSFRDIHDLNTSLRRLPDLVAGLFSDSCAEHFCGRDDWRDDSWIRKRHGHARHLGINRFLDRHERNAIYVYEALETRFLAALDQVSVVAMRGLPGTGKTFLALELACRLRQPLRRIYYATLKDAATPERLWQSARRRLSLPVLFVLDDCHLAPDAAGSILERLAPELRNGKLKLVLLLRDQAGSAVDELDDSPEWLARLDQERAIIDLRADPARTLAVTRHLRPDFTGLSGPRLERLHRACGGDLLLLDELLQNLATPQDIDTLCLDRVLPKLRSHYFSGNRRLPTLAKLAALTQFDLVPQADFFDGQWQPGEEALADPLMARLFAPPRYQFLHSSLAELMLHALTQLDVDEGALDKTVISNTDEVLRSYLLHLRPPPGRSADDSAFMLALQRCLWGRLKLMDGRTEARLKAAVLGDEEIRAIIETNLGKQSFTTLHLCVLLLSIAEHPAQARYIDLVEQRFRILFQHAQRCDDAIGVMTIGTGLFTLRRNASDRWVAVLDEHGAENFLRLILANGTLSELFHVLQYATPAFRTAVLDQLAPTQAATLIDKTIAAGRSIGTLDLAMRELGKADPELLGGLEQAIGAPNFLRLILANGTLFELFRVFEYATAAFRTALLEQLTPTQAATLIDKTIAEARGIENLHFTFRTLAAHSDQRNRLEQVLGVEGWWRLFIANGSLNSLSQITQTMTENFRAQVIAAATELSVPDWHGIIARGLFLNTCSFATDDLPAYPVAARNAFRSALEETAAPLAARASWFDLNPSRPPADPEHAEGTILRAALRTRIETVQVADLFELDFRETVNALACCWRERPDLRPDLVKNLRDILPPPSTWPRDKGEVAALHLVLALARNAAFPEQDARQLLAEIETFLDLEVCADINTLPLFELVWNMAALCYERGQVRNFAATFSHATQKVLLAALSDRVRLKGPNEEKLAQLALAGLLAFLFPQHKVRLIKLLAPLKGAAPWLAEFAMQQSFVAGLFALMGISMQAAGKNVFTPLVCAGLLWKSKDYEDVGPAIENLRQYVSQILAKPARKRK